ncbi:MAG: hypothetical protein CMI09_02210 [Oceanospirillaceae bacterium]|nr:hypothetical protein [Oceanospirillaceae bacterium]|tara:strand:- start:1306 stop:1533 length:228 start_codon:yes stop_codon:yes gene_type:complete
MEKHISREHARRIVSEFRSGLSSEVQSEIGEIGFGTLEMMIESALSTQVSTALEETIGDLQQSIERARQRMQESA